MSKLRKPIVMKNTVKAAVDYQAKYWDTYKQQAGYQEYNVDTLIDDALYGLGVAINKKYRYSKGYEQFKKDLIKHLST